LPRFARAALRLSTVSVRTSSARKPRLGATGRRAAWCGPLHPERAMRMRLLSGRGHYDTVVQAVMNASRSVWISTANLKELMVEDGRAVPGRARTAAKSGYRSVLKVFDALAKKKVDLRILHASSPSRAFRADGTAPRW
jgi:hypothetical protein